MWVFHTNILFGLFSYFWIKYRININWNENKAEIIPIASQWLCSCDSIWAIKRMLLPSDECIFRIHCFWTLFLSRIIMFMRFSPEKKWNYKKMQQLLCNELLMQTESQCNPNKQHSLVKMQLLPKTEHLQQQEVM